MRRRLRRFWECRRAARRKPAARRHSQNLRNRAARPFARPKALDTAVAPRYLERSSLPSTPPTPHAGASPMFTLFDTTERHTRRNFLRIGSLGLGGLTLSHLLGARAAAAESKSVLNDKSVIFLFLHGGPSQYETFDPKMAPRKAFAASPARRRRPCPASPSAAPSPSWRSGPSSWRSCARTSLATPITT